MGFFSSIKDMVVDPLDLTGRRAKKTAKDAAKSASNAAQTQADYQTQALDYLKETEALPRQFREGALTELAGMYGLEGGAEGSLLPDQAQMLEQAQMSPLYSALLEGGEDAVLRARSATGELRSGGAISDIKDVQNDALLSAYNQQQAQQQQQIAGLQGLAGLPSYAPQIADATGQIGQTLAQGITGSAQARVAGANQQQANRMSLLNLGMQAAAAFSDIRLKEDIKHVGYVGEHKWYEWVWNKAAESLGLTGKGQGVMAHEVYEADPSIIGECEGFITVNYGALYD